VRRYLRHYQHSGHIWQGRFKAFPAQDDERLVTVVRYVERNALRANLVQQAESWPWSSLANSPDGPPLDTESFPRAAGWIVFVKAAMTEAENEAVRLSVRRDRPYGSEAWTIQTAKRLGLGYSLRAPGRPVSAETVS
jgi:putative transposase